MDRTAINQPPDGGSDYPFAVECPLAAHVLDAYVSYAGFEAFPLTLTATGAGYDVTDAADAPIASLDVLEARTAAWGDRTVLEWDEEDVVVRLVVYGDRPGGESGELDPRTYGRLASRVSGLTVSGLTFAGPVEVVAGYNVSLALGETLSPDGGRSRTSVLLDGVPGAGSGRLPGCEEAESFVRRINLVSPGPDGNFRIETDGCVRVQPLLAVGAGDLPYATATEATLVVADDCEPCCSCDDYVNTYAGLVRSWNLWVATAAAAEAVRDTLVGNKARWEAEALRRQASPLRLVAAPEAGCRVFIGGTYCHMRTCCLLGLELRFTLQWYLNGVLQAVEPNGVMVTYSAASGAGSCGERAYSPNYYPTGSPWPVVSYDFASADSQSTSMAKFRVGITCAEGLAIKVTLTAHVSDAEADGCDLPLVAVPADIAAAWLAASAPPAPARFLASALAPLDSARPSFYGGDCN